MKCVLLLSLCVLSSVSLPVRKNGRGNGEKQPAPGEFPSVPGLDLEEYKRYLGEMARSDPNFMERLRKIKDFDMEKLKDLLAKNPHLQGRLSQGVGEGHEAVRSQLEESRRLSIEQMRQLQRLQSMRDNNLMKDGDWMTKKEAARENLSPHFTDQQIQAKLAEAQRNLQELDQQRREEFKREEMWVEHRRRLKLAEMNEQQRLKSEEEFKRKQAELRKHERVPHPASKEQLESVWEEDDGLSRKDFDPKTFFHMHDTNGDKMLDAMELEALFYNELKKVYKEDMGGIEAQEDMARMREHALSEMDKDENGMISVLEFMQYTHNKLYENKEEWHPVVDEDPPFSDKEFEKFEEDYEDDYDYQYDADGNVIGIIPKKVKHPQGQPPQPGNEQGQPQPGNEQGQPQPGNEQGQPQQHGDEQGNIPQHGKQGQPPQTGNEQRQPPQHRNEQGQPHQTVNEQGQPKPGNEQRQPPPAGEIVRGDPGAAPVVEVVDPQVIEAQDRPVHGMPPQGERGPGQQPPDSQQVPAVEQNQNKL